MAAKKSDIRRQLLARREELTGEERDKAAFLVTERLLGHQWFYKASYLLCFASFGSEIDTYPLMEEAMRLGKKVFLPRVEGRDMVFYRIANPMKLIKSRMGVPEPEGSTERFTMEGKQAEDVLMVMPGLAYDMEGNRMGYGGGYYDRYLSAPACREMRTIAIGFRCQQTEHIPADAWDVRPGQILLR